jgi:hypothetical protein
MTHRFNSNSMTTKIKPSDGGDNANSANSADSADTDDTPSSQQIIVVPPLHNACGMPFDEDD